MCSALSDETLHEIAAACPRLRQLDLSMCPNVVLDGVRFPVLEIFRLKDCDGLVAQSVPALNFSVALEVSDKPDVQAERETGAWR